MSTRPSFDVSADFAEQLVSAVTHGWVEATARKPWAKLTEAERVDPLPALLRHLLDIVFSEPDDRANLAAIVRDAATHGEQRRKLGIDEDALLLEYYLLRQLLWEEFQEAFGVEGAEPVILRVDAALSLVTAASIHGYHRKALEAQGRWPAALDELAARDDATD
jgi:hypothetical protein